MHAVIQIGGSQYLVAKNDELEVNSLSETKSFTLKPLLVFDEKAVKVGTPHVEAASVKIEIIEPELKAKKVQAIRYKAKKRVKTIRGHRQTLSRIKIADIKA